jgi:phosphoribosylformylglycinamidine (FGAM) synthase-like enzyme
VIIRTILDSGSVSLPEKEKTDAAQWIADRFRALLFRDPSPTELKTFTDAWKSESCRPATILHAILTSTEYQHY